MEPINKQPELYINQPVQYINQPVQYISKRENAFKPDVTDFIFALIAFFLGYLYSRWVLFEWLGWGVALFTLLYLLTVTAYLIKKGSFNNKPAVWFWFSIVLLTGASYALWENSGISFIRILLLFGSAIYYVSMATDNLLIKKTSNYLIIDGLNAVLILPLLNFFNQYLSFKVIFKKNEHKKTGKYLSVILGIVLTIVLFLILIPLLMEADSGGFMKLLKPAYRFLIDFIENIDEYIIFIVLAIPVAAYLYGLVSGSVHKKCTDTFKRESLENGVASFRKVQQVTIYILLGAVCGLYLLFIFSQIPYFFSAFTGNRPVGWLIYSEYARRGFFELCAIAAINLLLITIINVISKQKRTDNKMLKIFNITISVITLILITTALSKMLLYIEAYGLTMLRLLPCIFMIIMAAVFISLIFLQIKHFSIVRFSLVFASVLICLLCLSNPDAFVVQYNTDRFLDGTLNDYDVEILYRSGSAGVMPAYRVFISTTDTEVKAHIRDYLSYQAGHNSRFIGNSMFLESARAGSLLDGLNEQGLFSNLVLY